MRSTAPPPPPTWTTFIHGGVAAADHTVVGDTAATVGNAKKTHRAGRQVIEDGRRLPVSGKIQFNKIHQTE
ncbi:hypothetical protein TSUD_123510 [Trifolium subterraneum]|uniref:Uncharacterized protein n=1 Tax=Trifolium subterraneum TaxID=3900 RepID=A0A2Z6LSV7_TRISU|nr:hypothetical protein TSUD_123510 [Trifolium subterraneum]